jgi:eukaryotic-like serine/threonine-protein kinase
MSSPQTVPKQLGEYELLERLGGSATGPVFQARHRTTGRMYALKVLPPDLAKQETVLKRFEREAELAKRLNHPSLIVAFDSGRQDGVAYLVTEYFTGTDLAKLVQERGPLPVDEAQDYFEQAAAGLGYLHSQGVVHRNVKPHNLLVGKNGNLKIGNLLLARLEDGSLMHDDGVSIEELTRTGQMMGSVDYLPPEQARDSSRVDARADIYALACTLHHLLLGKPPYARKSPMQTIMAHSGEPIPSLCAAREDVPAELDRLFQRMMAKEPDKRPASMDACLQALAGGNRTMQFARWAIPLTIVLVLAVVLYLVMWR